MPIHGPAHLLGRRLISSPTSISVLLPALALGPGLTTLDRISLAQEGGASLAPAWLQFIALWAALGAIWALTGTAVLRRGETQPHQVLVNALLVGAWVALIMALASISMGWAGLHAELALPTLAPIKLGAVSALALTFRSNQPLIPLALTAGVALLLGPAFPTLARAGLPLEPGPTAQLLASLGFLLVALARATTPKPSLNASTPCATQS